jgi:hypothetical protein
MRLHNREWNHHQRNRLLDDPKRNRQYTILPANTHGGLMAMNSQEVPRPLHHYSLSRG